jgi:hypothetical protein
MLDPRSEQTECGVNPCAPWTLYAGDASGDDVTSASAVDYYGTMGESMSKLNAVLFKGFREYESNRAKTNDAIMALHVSRHLALDRLGSQSYPTGLTSELFPLTRDIGRLNLPIPKIREVIESSERHFAYMAIPHILAMHHETIKSLERLWVHQNQSQEEWLASGAQLLRTLQNSPNQGCLGSLTMRTIPRTVNRPKCHWPEPRHLPRLHEGPEQLRFPQIGRGLLRQPAGGKCLANARRRGRPGRKRLRLGIHVAPVLEVEGCDGQPAASVYQGLLRMYFFALEKLHALRNGRRRGSPHHGGHQP